MGVFIPTTRRLRNTATTAVLAAACYVGFVLSAGVAPAEARKGGGSKALTWEATKAPANKIVRDHRGTAKVLPPPQGPRPGSGGCARWPNTPSCHPIVRDHRGPRVVPKEDPPQKW
jgi:hypothetical protein